MNRPMRSGGFSRGRLKALDDRLSRMIDEGLFPGAVLQVMRRGEPAHLAVLGRLAPDGPAMPADAIFRIYSMTKPVVSVAAMMLVEQGRLDLAQPLHDLIPEFRDMQVAAGRDAAGATVTEPARRPISIQDLMRHTSGITYEIFGDGPAREAYAAAKVGDPMQSDLDAARRIASLPLEHHPGEAWEYGRSTDVLGAVIELVTGRRLGDAIRGLVLAPLGMKDSGFAVPSRSHPRLAEPHEAEAALFFDPRLPRRFESGNIGMVSTAADYSRFAQMLLGRGALDGVRLLSPSTVGWMCSDHLGDIGPGRFWIPGPGYGFGLGVAVRRFTGQAAVAGTAGEYHWGGRGGTMWWNDPAQGLSVVLMVQTVANRAALRAPVRNMLYAALTGD